MSANVQIFFTDHIEFQLLWPLKHGFRWTLSLRVPILTVYWYIPDFAEGRINFFRKAMQYSFRRFGDNKFQTDTPQTSLTNIAYQTKNFHLICLQFWRCKLLLNIPSIETLPCSILLVQRSFHCVVFILVTFLLINPTRHVILGDVLLTLT